jgi:hypothetical protein
MKPDPIVQPTSGNASPKNTSAGKVKSISGGGPAFSGSNANTKSSPSPNNPYKGR